MVRRNIDPPPPPVPHEIRYARAHIPDAVAALERATKAGSRHQLADALRSAKHFIACAEKEAGIQANTAPPPEQKDHQQ